MADHNYDVLVIGSGPGGKHAAIAAAHAGKRVGIIERKPKLGGVSLQSGTIPSKALREAAFLQSRFAAKGMRSAVAVTLKNGNRAFLQEAVQTKNTIIDNQASVLLSQLMSNRISIIPGDAHFVDPHTLEINDSNRAPNRISADHIILATGSRPRRPDFIPFDKELILDSTSILKLEHIPESLVVVGGGVIACELATMFASLGVKITLIDSHNQLLSYLDEDIISILAEHMQDMNIDLYMSTQLQSVVREGKKVVTCTTDQQKFESSHLLYAMGRIPNIEHLQLDKTGIIYDNDGWIEINEDNQTSLQHLFAIGDLAGRPALAATAMEQGRRAIAKAFNLDYQQSNAPLPMAIYTIPELSYVGATERELQTAKRDYQAGHARYDESARGQIIGEIKGQLKILADKKTHELLGIHIIGESASELIHVGQIAMGCNGKIEHLANNVYNYPTLAECYKSAALDCLNKLSH